ncbi:MAG: hypothetical protein JSV12_04510 [Candidatus Bathyarchaeota archaeon]|nr:MAG: hypothetical protein JSV12_04510 [Candidatus Bathyarchaeota archaeon]
MHKFLFVIISIILLANVALIAGGASSTYDEIELIGSSFRNSIDVNGTAVIGFLLQSEGIVSNVVVSYLGLQERLVNETMSLVKGNGTYGWWETTIIPKVWTEKVDGELRNHIEAMKLYVTLPHVVMELAVPQGPTWSTREQKVIISVLSVPSVLLLIGSILSVTGVTIALKQNRQGKKEKG